MRSQQYDILVVDDDAEDRMMMSEAFSQLDCQHRVTVYDSSGAFHRELTELRELNPLPLLTVLDYNLPGTDGALLLVQLKTDPVLCTIPVVMYTKRGEPHPGAGLPGKRSHKVLCKRGHLRGSRFFLQTGVRPGIQQFNPA